MTPPAIDTGPTPGSVAPDRGPPHRDVRLQPLPREWYARPVLEVARDLLGTLIVREHTGARLVGRIVEVEAYDGPHDRASHARAGLTARTAPMFGEPGHAYVYLVYGVHHCLNVVAHPAGRASAVLIRSLEPLEAPAALGARAASGPGLVGRWLSVDRSTSGHDLTTGHGLWLSEGSHVPDADVLTGPRIGVAYAGPDWAPLPWRFGVRGSRALSRPFPGIGQEAGR